MPRLVTTLALGLVLGLLLGEARAAVAAESPPWNRSAILDDPEWRAHFLGSYGFLSGVEPQTRADELALLREVIDLMKVDPRAAAQMLASQTTAESSASLDFILANLQFQNGQLAEAAASYGKALDKFPDFRRAQRNVGLLILQSGDYAGAVGHLTKAVELGDRDGRTFGLIGYCYLNLENYVAAEEAYRNAILYQPDSRDWKLGLARALQSMEKHEEAAAHFASLIEADPSDATAWKGQANAFLGLGKPQAAAVNLEALRVMGRADASTLQLLGDIYMNEGMYDLARSAYVEVIEKDPSAARFDTAYRAADLLVKARAWDEARQVADTIDARFGKSLDTDQQLALLGLRAKLARAQKRDAEAVAILESSVERDGTRGDALLELAQYHHDHGDEARALLYVERAQNLEQHEYDALLRHAQFRVAERDYAKAAELLRAALAIKSEPRVESYLARIEQIGR